MVEFKAITYEQARADFLKAEMERAENRMRFWQTKIKKAKNAIAEIEAHDNASNAGWEYNFYKDSLEALENQPKWISVEEKLPEEDICVFAAFLYYDGYRIRTARYSVSGEKPIWLIGDMHAIGSTPTHWMPLPPKPEVNK